MSPDGMTYSPYEMYVASPTTIGAPPGLVYRPFWDRYQKYHVALTPRTYGSGSRWAGQEYNAKSPTRDGMVELALFDTDELLLVIHSWDGQVVVDERHDYNASGVRGRIVHTTTDDTTPTLFMADGRPIPKTVLADGGGTTLWVDEAQGVAVALWEDGSCTTEQHEYARQHGFPEWVCALPEQFFPGMVYYASPTSVPQATRPIRLSWADTTVTRDERAQLKDLRDACIAWAQMTSEVHPPWAGEKLMKYSSHRIAGELVYQTEAKLQIADLRGKASLRELTPAQRWLLATIGHTPWRTFQQVPRVYTAAGLERL